MIVNGVEADAHSEMIIELHPSLRLTTFPVPPFFFFEHFLVWYKPNVSVSLRFFAHT